MALMVPSSSFMKKLTISSIYFARVCEKNSGSGWHPAPNKRPSHQPRRYNCESESLSLLVIFPFFRPTQPPPPSFSTETAGYSAWVMRLNDFTTSGACLRAAKRRRKCAPLSTAAVLLIILLWIARRRTHHDFWDRKEGRHWVRLELPNKRKLPTYCCCLSFQPDVPNWKSPKSKLYELVGRSSLLASSDPLWTVHVRLFFFFYQF
jgi:hypothetical protein